MTVGQLISKFEKCPSYDDKVHFTTGKRIFSILKIEDKEDKVILSRDADGKYDFPYTVKELLRELSKLDQSKEVYGAALSHTYKSTSKTLEVFYGPEEKDEYRYLDIICEKNGVFNG